MTSDSYFRALATDGVVLLDGEVVLLERDHPPEEGRWVLPGGMVEHGETARSACAREVREEAGLEVRPASFVGLYDAPGRTPEGTSVPRTAVSRPARARASPNRGPKPDRCGRSTPGNPRRSGSTTRRSSGTRSTTGDR